MKKYLNKFKIYWSKVPDWLQDSLSFITSISAFIGLIYGAAKVIYKALLQITGNTLPIDFPWIICIHAFEDQTIQKKLMDSIRK